MGRHVRSTYTSDSNINSKVKTHILGSNWTITKKLCLFQDMVAVLQSVRYRHTSSIMPMCHTHAWLHMMHLLRVEMVLNWWSVTGVVLKCIILSIEIWTSISYSLDKLLSWMQACLGMKRLCRSCYRLVQMWMQKMRLIIVMTQNFRYSGVQ